MGGGRGECKFVCSRVYGSGRPFGNRCAPVHSPHPCPACRSISVWKNCTPGERALLWWLKNVVVLRARLRNGTQYYYNMLRKNHYRHTVLCIGTRAPVANEKHAHGSRIRASCACAFNILRYTCIQVAPCIVFFKMPVGYNTRHGTHEMPARADAILRCERTNRCAATRTEEKQEKKKKNKYHVIHVTSVPHYTQHRARM